MTINLSDRPFVVGVFELWYPYEPHKILKGQIVEILPEFQDPGDSEYVWLVIEDEEKR